MFGYSEVIRLTLITKDIDTYGRHSPYIDKSEIIDKGFAALGRHGIQYKSDVATICINPETNTLTTGWSKRMKKPLSQEQMDFLLSRNISFNNKNLSETELDKLEDKIPIILMKEGLDSNYDPLPVGKICESILDSINE